MNRMPGMPMGPGGQMQPGMGRPPSYPGAGPQVKVHAFLVVASTPFL